MRLTIRTGKRSDAAAIGRLAERAYDADGLLPDAGAYRDEVRDGAARLAQGEVLTAWLDRELVGSIVLLRRGTPLADIALDGEVELRLLNVAPDLRRRGIARALMAAAIERAQEQGAAAVVLCTAAWMHAHALYEELGFERVPERDWQVPQGTLLTYRLAL